VRGELSRITPAGSRVHDAAFTDAGDYCFTIDRDGAPVLEVMVAADDIASLAASEVISRLTGSRVFMHLLQSVDRHGAVSFRLRNLQPKP